MQGAATNTPPPSGAGSPPPLPSGSDRGLPTALLSLVGSLGRYLQAITSIAGVESREAVALYVRLLVMLAGACFLGALGYILLVVSAAFAAAFLLGIPWTAILATLAFVHLALAFVCANHVRTHIRTPVFSSTRSEIAADLQRLGRKP